MTKLRNYWTFDRCSDEAKKYTSKKEFREKSFRCYAAASRKKWLSEICKHMNLKETKPYGYWTIKENCAEEAKKYKSRIEFSEKSASAYRAVIENGWGDEMCGHMLSVYKPKRCIYAVEFSDNHVYIGLTFDVGVRFVEHIRKSDYNRSSVYEHIIETNLTPIIKQLSEYIDVCEASELEEKIKEKYKDGGWVILNKVKCGAIGGNIKKWTKEKCVEEALKYTTRSEFQNESPGAYGSSVDNDWLDETCLHMLTKKVNPRGFWTFEKCAEEALKYTKMYDLRKGSPGAYHAMVENGWRDELCLHIVIRKMKPSGYWTKEKCAEEAKKYIFKSEFYKKSNTAFSISYKNKWLDEICAHMDQQHKPYGHWTKENCLLEAKKYNSISDFMKNSYSAYTTCSRNRWLKEACAHMISDRKPSGYWTKEKCTQEAKKYIFKSEFLKNSPGAFNASVINGWISELFPNYKKKQSKIAA